MVFVTFWLSVYKDIQDQAKNDRNFLSEVIETLTCILLSKTQHMSISSLMKLWLFLFPKMNIQLQGQRFEDIVKIQAKSQTLLDSIMEQEF